ncbi:MAG: hypothetical protein ACREHV_00230 [Rhizomicrobium sp.]
MRCNYNYLALAALTAFASASTAAHADVTLSSAATQDMSCSGGVCAPTAKDAVLNVGDLETMLASGNVEVTTKGAGVQANNIDIDAALSWPDTNTLSLDAYDSIDVNKPVTVTGLSGLAVTTNDGGSGGTFSFGKKGHVTFQNLSSQLGINGTAYTLVGTVAALSSAIQNKPGGAYALAANYDASNDGTYKNSPIQTTLTGNVQGLGNTISKLKTTCNAKDANVGLFTWVGSSGAVENLRLIKLHLKVSGSDTFGAGLVGINDGLLLGDEVSGSAISNDAAVGGLVGANRGDIMSSWAALNISSCCGGLVIENSGTINLSHANGAVPDGAGFVEDNEGTISQSYATGAATFGDGFAIYNDGDGTFAGEIDNSYATGAAYDAGFVGFNGETEDVTVTSSYSTGAVAQGEAGFDCDAAFANAFTYDYWDTTTSGTEYGFCNDENFAGVTGLTSNKLKSRLPKGFDPKIWALDPKINKGFPYLVNNAPQK